jgi:hypothetical protein
VITPDLGDFMPGGVVTVTVSCTVQLSGLGLLRIPGSETITASASSPIDVYRGRALGFTNSEGSSAANPSIGGALCAPPGT